MKMNGMAFQPASQSARRFLKAHTMDLNAHLNQETCYILNIWLFESPLNSKVLGNVMWPSPSQPSS
jgi:hypothetical protein